MMLRVFMSGLGFIIGFFLVDYFFFGHVSLNLILSSFFSFLGGAFIALLFYWIFSLVDKK
ncbi:Uncharacterised protein [uncultured archaeon]|nr:Uncharacterised protein [uncultured archaeon]